MAPLTPIHWETITPQMRDLLTFLGQQPLIERFYLAGGTGLALQRHPNLPEDDFNWRVTRRLQGNQRLGKEFDLEQDDAGGA